MTIAPPIPAERWDQVPPDTQAASVIVLTQLASRIHQLKQRVADLDQRLGGNTSNSPIPPPADPPSAPRPVVKRPTGRMTGGQPCHHGHSRQRLPRQRVAHVIPLIPSHCARGHLALPPAPRPGGHEPTWHQGAELPRLAALVTEFQGLRYVERLLSVLQTVGPCGGQAPASLTEAIKAYRHGLPAPPVLLLP
jgi:hypothetical protein